MNNKTAAVATLLLTASYSATVAAEERPNFVLFMADDCSYYDLGCYGSVDSITPNIDNFAKQGMKFNKGYEAAPMSSPTRHNLYTGIWPVKSGAYPNHTCAYDGTLSVVHHLHPLGYKVALIGKSHVSPKSVFPFDTEVPNKNGEINHEAIRSFIKECEASNTPFCIFVMSNQPHSPWNKGDATQFKPKELTLPPFFVDTPMTRNDFSKYLAEVNFMDKEFGDTLKVLDDEGVRDDSVVVFLSEQGNSFPFAKWTCYNAGVHSAYLVQWSGVVKPNSESDALVEYVDIVPTFVDIAGGKPVAPVDGESIRGVLEGKKRSHKRYTFSIQTTRGIGRGSDHYGIRAVSDGKFRYIINLTPEMKFQDASTENVLFKNWLEKAETDAEARKLTERYQYRPATELYNEE